MQKKIDSKTGQPPVVFTIVSNNYFAYAATLMNSVAEKMPLSHRIIYICDKLIEYPVSVPAEIVSVE